MGLTVNSRWMEKCVCAVLAILSTANQNEFQEQWWLCGVYLNSWFRSVDAEWDNEQSNRLLCEDKENYIITVVGCDRLQGRILIQKYKIHIMLNLN